MTIPEGLWRETIETLPSEIALLDADGTIRYTNQQWQDFGRDNGLVGGEVALLGEDYLAITAEADDEYAQQALDGLKALLTGERSQFTLEYPCHSPDEQRWFRMSAQRLDYDSERYLVVEHLDITDRKLAELAVKEKNERLEGLHSAAYELLKVDSKQRAADIAVSTIRDVLGLSIVTLWLYDADRDVLDPIASTDEARAMFDEIPTYSGEESLSWQAFTDNTRYVFDDLREATERYNPETPIKSEIILPVGRHGVFNIGATESHAFDEMDITLAEIWITTLSQLFGRLDREKRLHDRERELTRERDRLEQFASFVSHDLRNPLNVATGRLDLAVEECDNEHLEAIAQALDRMEQLIEDLLTLAREGETVGETEPVELADLVIECWTTVETSSGTLEIETDRTIQTDRSRLAGVFENLFRNAIEHGREDVTITVGDLPGGSGFFVEDDGPGIPEDEREQVFERGYSTIDEGTGFGLAIVKQIVEAHGWEITATEGTAGGVRFEIRT